MMRKILITGLVALLSLVLTYGFSDAAVSGVCSNCHTMHNSQNGAAVASGGPYSYLLNKGAIGKTACWGCHAQSLATYVDSVNTPQVSNSGVDLAGGNFGYIMGTRTIVTGTTQTVGHNVKDTGVTEATITGTIPPGDENSTGITAANFTCAGQYGCHGTRTATSEYEAVKGAHHTNDSVLKFGSISDSGQGGTVGTSYRFLKGVKGGEETSWEAVGPSETVHNEYKGKTGGGDSNVSATSPGTTGTISGLCAECHGDFHYGTDISAGTTSPWIRHPTDVLLNDTSSQVVDEYKYYNSQADGSNKYNYLAPVARPAIPNAIEDDVDTDDGSGTDGAIVMCLSCHRAHASAYADILRWQYNMNAGGGQSNTGCFVCHTKKDTGQ